VGPVWGLGTLVALGTGDGDGDARPLSPSLPPPPLSHHLRLGIVGALQPLQTKWVLVLQPMHFLLCCIPLGCGWCSLASWPACWCSWSSDAPSSIIHWFWIKCMAMISANWWCVILPLPSAFSVAVDLGSTTASLGRSKRGPCTH
jgi:hypothetical protein